MSASTARGFALYCVFGHVPLTWSLRAASTDAHPSPRESKIVSPKVRPAC
jgi:hypothetical protein